MEGGLRVRVRMRERWPNSLVSFPAHVASYSVFHLMRTFALPD